MYLYVVEDTMPRRFAHVGPNVYSVFEATDVRDDGSYRLSLVCGGLGKHTIKYFASYPEVPPLLIERWVQMQDRDSWKTSWRSKRPLARAIAEAESKHGPARMPQTALRSAMEQRFGDRPV